MFYNLFSASPFSLDNGNDADEVCNDLAEILVSEEIDWDDNPFSPEPVPVPDAAQEGGGLLDQDLEAAIDIPDDGQGPALHLPEHFNIVHDGQQHFPHFGYTSRKLQIRSHGPPRLFIREVLELLLAQCNESDRVAMTVSSEHDPTVACHMPFRPPSQLTVDMVLTRIEEMMQSGGMDGDFYSNPILLTFHKVTLPEPEPVPQGEGGPTKRGMKPRDVFLKDKKSCVLIKNKDTICLARALVVAIAYQSHHQNPSDTTLRNRAWNVSSKDLIQRRAAQELMAQARVTIPECPSALPAFQAHLQGYRIVVVEEKGGKPCVVYDGRPEDSENNLPRLYLWYANNHFDLIIKISAAFGCVFFCEACMEGFQKSGRHKCEAYCRACFATPVCPRPDRPIKCSDCLRLFNGQACVDRHKAASSTGNSLCSQVYICKNCVKSVDMRNRKPSNPHCCNEVYCQACKKYMPHDHLCYMQPLAPEHVAASSALAREASASLPPPPKRAKVTRQEKNVVFIFYDLETIQTTKHAETGGLVHQPILCVSQKVCLHCVDKEVDRCNTCGDREQIFKGTQCIKLFIDYVQTFFKYEKVYCMAHNAKSYDAQFLLKHMIEDRQWDPEVLETGTKLMYISHFKGQIIFLDSLNFIPLPLSQFSKAFGLGEGSLKGDFPHFLFNVVENQFDPDQFPGQNFTLATLPPVEAYGADQKGESERKTFLDWHAAHFNDGFNFDRDIVAYCSQDVSILRRGSLAFRHIFLENAQFDPFRSAITIASTCLKIFRTRFLPHIPEKIAVLPAGNKYRLKDQQSKAAFTYLAWMESQLGYHLESAFHGCEKRILGMKVDGFDPKTKKVYEFHGDFFHACPRHYPARSKSFFGDPSVTFAMRYEATLQKTAKLRNAGYEVIEMWECDFQQESRDNADLRQFLTTFSVPEKFIPLDPREAFFGGRTEALKLYHRCEENETVSYQDFTSLYPWCNKYGKYAIGHPKIFLGDDPQIPAQEDWEGLVKCAILPPRGLYLPLVPYRMDGKLFFPLCHTCVTERKDVSCTHTEEERTLHGTWVSDEIKKAVQLGYRVVKVHELWQYETVQFDRETKTGGLFAEYVNMFLRLKQEASGWPVGCVTEEQKQAYLDEYWAKEGIRLNRENIRFNPGLRQIAKLALNSFWGKFGQRADLSKTEIVKDPKRFFGLLSDPNVDVYSCMPVSDTLMVVKWGYVAQVDVMQTAANVIVAAYTTCNARLKLYSVLEQLGERALYLDTDSVLYRCLPGEQVLSTGNFLGELTDEVAGYGVGAYISEFASGGPKNYGYKVMVPGSNTTHESFKVKGIRLNHTNSAIVNLDRLKVMLGVNSDDRLDSVQVFEPHNIRRLRDHTVVSKPQSKTYRVVFDKRRRVDPFDSLPWGY